MNDANAPDQVDDLDDRLAILVISPWDVVRILAGEMRITNLPTDARLMHAVAPFQIHGWALLFRHRDFPPVEEGMEYPHIIAIAEVVEQSDAKKAITELMPAISPEFPEQIYGKLCKKCGEYGSWNLPQCPDCLANERS